MRRGGIDIHPRDYAAYVGAKKDRAWGSVVQLHAFAAVYDIDVNVWTRERDGYFRFVCSVAAHNKHTPPILPECSWGKVPR